MPRVPSSPEGRLGALPFGGRGCREEALSRARMTLPPVFEVVTDMHPSEGRGHLTGALWEETRQAHRACSVLCLKPGLARRKPWAQSSLLKNGFRKTEVEKGHFCV